MRKNILLLTVLLVALQSAAQNVNNHPITIDEAQEIAVSFFDYVDGKKSSTVKRRSKGMADKPILAYKAGTDQDVSFYVFNNASEGFVLIGAKSDMPSILGFSYTDTFDYEKAPDNFLWWMKQYEMSGTMKKASTNTTKHSIAPLLTTKWGQNEPFNNAIPSLGANYRAFPTGCTATAMSQVMKYYNYPQNGTGSNSYSITYNGTNTLNFHADFANTRYDWNNMLDDYSAGYNQSQADAVATIMYHAGVSENMKYSNMSSADSKKGAIALINNFNYDKGLTCGERKYFTDDDWENIIYTELANGRPVLYSGTSVNGDESIGHEFICHGYNADYDLYAINWGWAGLYDGYFALTGKMALNPYNKGALLSKSRSPKLSSADVDCDQKPILNYKLVPISGDPKPVLGVVADGSSQVKIVLDSSSKLPSSKCGYSYKWELSEDIGTLDNTESWNNIIYTAPEDFPADKPGSAIQIQAILTCTNENVCYTEKKVDIIIYRVPVLFVHGLNSKQASWDKMRTYIKKKGYSDALLHCVDYEGSHNDSFEYNKNVVGDKANDVISELLDRHRIVCKKVDVVGHSMGGLLTKKYIQNNGGGMFHKIITINTPHGGSQFGDFMIDKRVQFVRDIKDLIVEKKVLGKTMRYSQTPHPINRRFLRELYNNFAPSKTDINHGAVADLSVENNAIKIIDNNRTRDVKCHAIVTSSNSEWLLNQFFSAFEYANFPAFRNELFRNESCDLIVSRPSQEGGLLGNQTTFRSGGLNYCHIFTCDNKVIQDCVLDLLSKSLQSPAFADGFRHTGGLHYQMNGLDRVYTIYTPENIANPETHPNYHPTSAPRKISSNNTTSSSDDSYLILNSVYNVGDSIVKVSISSVGSFTDIKFGSIYKNNPLEIVNSSEGVLQLPKNTMGDLVVLYEGKCEDGCWFSATDTISINTVDENNLERVQFVNDTIYVREKKSSSVSVMCYWKDGTTTTLETPNLAILDQQIATIDNEYVIHAHKQGTTTIKATYLGKECHAVIDVYNTPTEQVSLFDEEDLYNYGYTSDQTIFYNIKPEEGGEYVVCLASKDDVILSDKTGETITSITINRATGTDKQLSFRYIPYNCGLASVNFQYGIIFRNLINGKTYSKSGGNSSLSQGYSFSQPTKISFTTSLISYNGIYEVLPAYSIDNGNTWQAMYYNASQEIPQIIIEGGDNDELVSLSLSTSLTQIQIGQSSYITYSPYYTGKISYVSSDTKIAEVTDDGEIIGISKGTATITANIEGDSFYKKETITFTIFVVDHECNPLILAISKNDLKIGETAVVVTPPNYFGVINYDVNPEGIVKVFPSGLISALSPGHAIITATSSPTYDFYETTNAITIDVSPSSPIVDDELCISKVPTVGTDNVISEGNSTMSVTILNNTESEIKNATLYYRLYLDDGRYWNRWTWSDLSAGKSFTHEFDLLTLKDYMTPGKKYTCYFFKDENFSQPMNVPSITFQYGVKESISVILNNNCTTLSLPFDSDIPAGLHAYEVKAYYKDILVMTEVPYLNRNHSYIISGDSKTYMFTGIVIPTSTNPRYGFMTGLHNERIVPKGNYVITDETKPRVRCLTDDEEMQKWSAYLTLPSSSSSNFPLLFPEDIANKIETIVANDNSRIIGIYDIDGKKLSHFQRGFNIIKYSNGANRKVYLR